MDRLLESEALVSSHLNPPSPTGPAAAPGAGTAAAADIPAAAAAAARPRVLVIAAHPDLRQSRVNRRLLQAARQLEAGATEAAPAASATVEVRDLYQRYPGFDIDVAAEQAALARADLVVWQHPVQWYAMPALMKLWVDEVLAHGWAYGQGGEALLGKSLWLVLSTGATEAAYSTTGYNRYFFDAFLPPYEQTAALCGLRFLPPLVLHGAHAATAGEIEAHARVYAQRLAGWPDPQAWPELDELPACERCVVPTRDRPQEATEGTTAPIAAPIAAHVPAA